MKKSPAGDGKSDPLEFEVESSEQPGIQLEFDASGSVDDDITSFDPFGAESGGQPASPAAPVAAPSRPLKLDFSELRDEDVRGAQRAGAGMLDTSQFASKEEQEALSRARRISSERPAVIELEEERKGAVRVVAENRTPYLWFGLGILAVAALVLAGFAVLHSQRQARLDAELQELIKADQAHREAELKRESQLAR